MIQQNQRINEDFEDIVLSLYNQKYLKVVVDKKLQYLGFGYLIDAVDRHHQQYSLLIHYINDPEVLQLIQKNSNILKSFNHPNIVNCIDHFQLGDYYFVQTERIPSTLLNWIHQNRTTQQYLDQDKFLDLALQMMEATNYLIQNKCSLYLESTLSCFMIDEESKIKLFYFNSSSTNEVSPLIVKQIFNTCVEQQELFYYPGWILELEKNNIVYRDYLFDSWALGICFYYMTAGVSWNHIIQYILRQEEYQYQDKIGFEINCILFVLIFHFKYKFQRSTPPLITKQLSIQKQKIAQKMYATETDVEVINKQKQLEDFTVFGKCFQSVYQVNNRDAAILEMNSLVKRYPDFDLMFFVLGRLQYAHSYIQESQISFGKSIALNPMYDSAYVNLGFTKNNDKQIYEQNRLYIKALEVNPNFLYALYQLGINLQRMGQHKEAISYFEKVIEINPQFESGYYQLASEYYALERVEDSIRCLIKEIEFKDSEAQAYSLLRRIYSNKQTVVVAKNYLEQIFLRDPSNYEVIHQLAQVYETTNDVKNAIVYYKKAISLNTKKLSSFINLAIIYEKQSLNQNAAFLYKNAALMDKNKNLERRIIENYKKQQKFQKTTKILKVFCKTYSADLESYSYSSKKSI